MIETHKHEGIRRKNGSYRQHPIIQKHKDSTIHKWHNMTLNSKQRKYWQGTRLVGSKQTKKVIKTKNLIEKVTLSKEKNLVKFDAKEKWQLIDFDNFPFKGIVIKKSGKAFRMPKTIDMSKV